MKQGDNVVLIGTNEEQISSLSDIVEVKKLVEKIFLDHVNSASILSFVFFLVFSIVYEAKMLLVQNIFALQ